MKSLFLLMVLLLLGFFLVMVNTVPKQYQEIDYDGYVAKLQQ